MSWRDARQRQNEPAQPAALADIPSHLRSLAEASRKTGLPVDPATLELIAERLER